MSLLYRAIWSDSRDEVSEFGVAAFQSWVGGKSAGTLSVPDEGFVEGDIYVPPRPPGIPEQRFHGEARVQRASGSGDVTDAMTASFVEIKSDKTRWDTTLRTWTEVIDQGSIGWLWVDVECVGPVELDRLAIAAPRLATDLIANGLSSHRGSTRLSIEPQLVSGSEQAEQLANTILDPRRDMPLVVFSSDASRNAKLRGFSFEQITRAAARSLAGVSVVYVADSTACWHLTSRLGQDYAVWGGALRTYLPNVDTSAPGDNYRHRYVLADRYMGFKNLAAETISRALGPASGTRRPPESYKIAKALLRDARSDNNEQLATLLQDDVASLTRQNESLRDELNKAEERYFGLAIDLDEAVSERADLAATLEAAQRQVRLQSEILQRNGIEDTSWNTQPEDDPVPDRADNLSDAAIKAQLYLSDRLVLPDDALRDLENLDSTAESGAWGQTAWRGFRALHAYAEDQAAGVNRGSFWDWCATSKHPLAWPATPKKLSMTESETVENNTALRDARVLPISQDVTPDGKVYMPSHLKIATGGGNLAPRIYFHYDSNGAKVHIGFFGPHKYMPNTKT